MKKYNEGKCKLIYRERRNLSRNGNPRHYVVFETPDGREIAGTTATDAACGYGISNYDGGRQLANIEYHITRTGNIIFDFIRDYREE